MRKGLKVVAVIVVLIFIQVAVAEAWTLTLRTRFDYWLRIHREIRVACEKWAKNLQEAEGREDLAEIMRAMTLLDYGYGRPFKFEDFMTLFKKEDRNVVDGYTIVLGSATISFKHETEPPPTWQPDALDDYPAEGRWYAEVSGYPGLDGWRYWFTPQER